MEDPPKPVFTKINEEPFAVTLREDWKAQSPKWTSAIEMPIKMVFCMPTDKFRCFTIRECAQEMKFLQKRHMNLTNCPDIRYSFVIGSNGALFEGRGWHVIPGLPASYRKHSKYSLLIGFTGKYSLNVMAPEKTSQVSKVMWGTYEQLIMEGLRQKYIDPEYLMYEL